MRNMSNVSSQIDPAGLSPKKTLFIMVTVVGCIAILWPKVFYPMMFGGPIKQNNIKDHRGGTAFNIKSSSTCCEVVLDKDAFLNVSLAAGVPTYRKQLNLVTGEISLRQERPMHLRPDTIHPAMRERGRAIPATQTVPIIERARTPSSPPRVVEGRPGPVPGMRPPLGAGSVHQAQPKSSNMGFIMPLYTIGIVAFFIYTIMKILFKKPVTNAPYGTSRADPTFHKEVFGHDKSYCKSRFEDCSGNNKLGLLDAADEQLKLREINSTKPNNLNKDSSSENVSNGHAKSIHQTLNNETTDINNELKQNQNNNNINNDSNYNNNNINNISNNIKENDNLNTKLDETNVDKIKSTNDDDDNNFSDNDDIINKKLNQITQEKCEQSHTNKLDKNDDNSKKSVVVLGMELTASCEGGQKWNRPPTPVFPHHTEHSTLENEKPEPQPIYLEGALSHESQILVADSKIQAESVTDEDLNGSLDEPAVILSSKMTLSLINLNSSNTDLTENNLNNNENNPLEENNNKNEEHNEDQRSSSHHRQTDESENEEQI